MNKNKALKIAVGSVAGVVLGGALIFFNFVEKEHAPVVLVGDKAPDFAVSVYDVENDTFQANGTQFILSEQKKLTIVNFWATWCGPCKAELPHFNELQKNYGEHVQVIALTGGNGMKGYTGIGNWLTSNPEADGWEDYAIKFGYYNEKNNDIFYEYGLTTQASWPSTVMVDENGEIVFIRKGGMTYEELESTVLQFLPDGTEQAPSTPSQPIVTETKNWWKENGLGVAFLTVSAAMLGAAIVVSAVSTAKENKRK